MIDLAPTRDREAGYNEALPVARGPKRRVASAVLLRGGRQLIIEHNGEEYQLRLTKNGKLILTK
jgi:hemin uptake protein HemP